MSDGYFVNPIWVRDNITGLQIKTKDWISLKSVIFGARSPLLPTTHEWDKLCPCCGSNILDPGISLDWDDELTARSLMTLGFHNWAIFSADWKGNCPLTGNDILKMKICTVCINQHKGKGVAFQADNNVIKYDVEPLLIMNSTTMIADTEHWASENREKYKDWVEPDSELDKYPKERAKIAYLESVENLRKFKINKCPKCNRRYPDIYTMDNNECPYCFASIEEFNKSNLSISAISEDSYTRVKDKQTFTITKENVLKEGSSNFKIQTKNTEEENTKIATMVRLKATDILVGKNSDMRNDNKAMLHSYISKDEVDQAKILQKTIRERLNGPPLSAVQKFGIRSLNKMMDEKMGYFHTMTCNKVALIHDQLLDERMRLFNTIMCFVTGPNCVQGGNYWIQGPPKSAGRTLEKIDDQLKSFAKKEAEATKKNEIQLLQGYRQDQDKIIEALSKVGDLSRCTMVVPLSKLLIAFWVLKSLFKGELKLAKDRSTDYGPNELKGSLYRDIRIVLKDYTFGISSEILVLSTNAFGVKPLGHVYYENKRNMVNIAEKVFETKMSVNNITPEQKAAAEQEMEEAKKVAEAEGAKEGLVNTAAEAKDTRYLSLYASFTEAILSADLLTYIKVAVVKTCITLRNSNIELVDKILSCSDFNTAVEIIDSDAASMGSLFKEKLRQHLNAFSLLTKTYFKNIIE